MTIKQQGGIFGRNPTFNDVDMQDLTAATGTVSGNLTANALGIGTTTIEGRAIVEGSGVDVRIYNSDAAANGDSTALIRAYKSTGYWNDLRLSGSNIVFDTFTGERARITNDGLTFNGDTAAANALSDYEEGNWTPVLVGSSSAGTATFVSGPNGTYTKIGNQVTVYFSWDISVHTGTGALRVNSLPFTASSATAIGSIMDGNYTYPASRTKLVPYAVGAVIRFYGVGSGVGYTENTLDVAHQMNGTMTYTV